MDKKIYFKVNGKNLWNGGLNYIFQLKKIIEHNGLSMDILIYDFDNLGIQKLKSYDLKFKVIPTKKPLVYFLKLFLKFNVSLIKPPSFIKNNDLIFYHGLIPIFYSKAKYNLIYWLPDLLHKFYKKNFSKKELFLREKFIKINLWKTKYILLSSNTVSKNLKDKYSVRKKTLVFKFTSTIDLNVGYNVKYNKSVVLFPHEFWKHKRHEKIVDLAHHNPEHIFILTGNKRINKKNSSYFKFIDLYNKRKCLNIILLGEVDLNTLHSLYLTCDYIGNLSDYEGWNTAVEIGKFLNKKLILSKIETHLEQVEGYKNVIWHEKNLKIPKNDIIYPFDYLKSSNLRGGEFCKELISL